MNEKTPVAGYRRLSDDELAAMNEMKQAEERVLQLLDDLAASPLAIDTRWLATGRTQIEKGFMAVNRSIAKPARIHLTNED